MPTLFALALLLALITPAHSYAQWDEPDSTRTTPANVAVPVHPYKDPTTALAYSLFIAGGGHLYAGETTRGGLLLGTNLLGLGIFFTAATRASEKAGQVCTDDCAWDSDATLGLGGLAIALAASITSLLDAPESARRMNRLHGYDEPRARPRFGVSPQGGVELGLSFSLR